MKVKITENTKKAFFISEMPCLEIAKNSLKSWNDNGQEITKDDIQMLGNFICEYRHAEILKADAEFAKNARVWDKYGEGSEKVDVWVNITIYDGWKNFYMVGAYLSDMWEIGGTDAEELKGRMFIQKFERQ